MESKIIEASSGPDHNWGRFMVQRYDANERAYESRYAEPGTSLTIWKDRPPAETALWVNDLITGEAAMYDLRLPLADQLERHQIWVCVLYEPFLQWLQAFVLEYQQRFDTWDRFLAKLPANVNLSAPVEFLGYRRGEWIQGLPDDAKKFLLSPAVAGALPRSLRALLKKLLPSTRTAT